MCAKLNFRFTEISEEIALKVCSGETLGSAKTGDGISFKVSVLSRSQGGWEEFSFIFV